MRAVNVAEVVDGGLVIELERVDKVGWAAGEVAEFVRSGG